MKYNNIIPEELVYKRTNELTLAISRADSHEDSSPFQRRSYVYSMVKILCNEDRNSKEIDKFLGGSDMKLEIKVFNYNGVMYYWWDLISGKGDWIASGLEFYPFADDASSFVLFATREGQGPFVFRENVRF